MKTVFKKQSGHTLVFAVPMAALLLFSSLAYLKWQVAAQQLSRHQVAATQAYYTAQAAVIKVPLAYMRMRRPNELQSYTEMTFPDGVLDGGFGEYKKPMIQSLGVTSSGGNTGGGLLTVGRDFLLSATGVVRYEDFRGRKIEVRRRAQLLLRRQQFSAYFYLTNFEQTRFGEFIWFWPPDTLQGRVHSNSVIGINGGVFHQLVTSTASYWAGNHTNATYYKGRRLNVPPVEFPFTAEYLRAAAAGGGVFLSSEGGTQTYGIRFEGNSGAVWRWPTGTPSPMTQGVPPNAGSIAIPGGSDLAIFCDGELWIFGHVNGRVGIGAAGNLRLLDNITYSGTLYENLPYQKPSNSLVSMMTLISEAPEPADRSDPWTGILIANTRANGRGGGRAAPAGSQHLRDIAIYGQLIALNSSFTFEDQNDTWDPFLQPLPNDYGQNNDERGTIFLRGAVAQKRRGYVHRSNRGGTGYAKGYIYDDRFSSGLFPPPFTIDVTNAGFAKWDIEGWQDIPRKPGDERYE
ncbi:MAG: hypothetical protein N2450_00915 [bacterium]|nr:hypothetical protein [bacterium]